MTVAFFLFFFYLYTLMFCVLYVKQGNEYALSPYILYSEQVSQKSEKKEKREKVSLGLELKVRVHLTCTCNMQCADKVCFLNSLNLYKNNRDTPPSILTSSLHTPPPTP